MGSGAVEEIVDLGRSVVFEHIAQARACITKVQIEGEGSGRVGSHGLVDYGDDIVNPLDDERSCGVVGCSELHISPRELHHIGGFSLDIW